MNAPVYTGCDAPFTLLNSTGQFPVRTTGAAKSTDMCGYNGPVTPLSLQLGTNGIPNEGSTISAAENQGSSLPGGNQGDATSMASNAWFAARLTYGHGAVRNIAIFDWIAGTYQLPPCDYAKLSILTYATQSFDGVGGQVQASFRPGLSTCQRDPTLTATYTIAAGSVANVDLSSNAYAIDLAAQFVGAGGGANDAILTLDSLAGNFVQVPWLKRDYSNYIFVPPWGPVLIGGTHNDTDGGVPASTAVSITNRGAATVNAIFTQFLKL